LIIIIIIIIIIINIKRISPVTGANT